MRVMLAPTGARRDKTTHPQIPMNIEEIAETAAAGQAAGATALHLHIRDAEGRHSLDPGGYRDAIAAVTARAPALDIQVTTEAAGRYGVESQLAVVAELRPAEASVSIREALREPDLAKRLYAVAHEGGIRIQHILFDTQDLAALRAAWSDGMVPASMRSVLLVLGRYAPPTDAGIDDLAPFVAAVRDSVDDWMVCAFGPAEHAVLARAAAMGGHVRVGFENNIFRPDGTPARDNAENVARIVTAAREMGRPLAARVPA